MSFCNLSSPQPQMRLWHVTSICVVMRLRTSLEYQEHSQTIERVERQHWCHFMPPDPLFLDSASNLGRLISCWEINKFENCWYKSVRILEVLKLLFQKFLNLSSSQRGMSGSILGALSNSRWRGVVFGPLFRNKEKKSTVQTAPNILVVMSVMGSYNSTKYCLNLYLFLTIKLNERFGNLYSPDGTNLLKEKSRAGRELNNHFMTRVSRWACIYFHYLGRLFPYTYFSFHPGFPFELDRETEMSSNMVPLATSPSFTAAAPGEQKKKKVHETINGRLMWHDET